MKKRKFLFKQIIGIVVFLLFTSCSFFDDDTESDKTANDYIYSVFKEWYLWYDQIPDVDPNNYETYQDLIDAIKVDVDKWSYAGSYTYIKNMYENAEYKGFGAGFMVDYDYQIKITHVYNASPFGVYGVERGWIVESVNGYTISNVDGINDALNSDNAVDFVFTDQDGQTRNLTTSRQSFQMNTVLYSNVYEYDSHKVGYLVFNSFLGTSVNELTPVIQTFHDQNITDLIVDLRYNGGGENEVAETLIGMIGGDKVKGQTITTRMHSDKKTKEDESTVSDYSGVSLNIEGVYFITTSGTASASELVINCIKPFMDTKLVGSTTSGKPVGMYIVADEDIDLAVLPVCFKNINSLGYGDYFDGIAVDISETDDLSHNWGDPEEGMFNTALNDILGLEGAGTVALKSKIEKAPRPLLEYKGLNQIINAY